MLVTADPQMVLSIELAAFWGCTCFPGLSSRAERAWTGECGRPAGSSWTAQRVALLLSAVRLTISTFGDCCRDSPKGKQGRAWCVARGRTQRVVVGRVLVEAVGLDMSLGHTSELQEVVRKGKGIFHADVWSSLLIYRHGRVVLHLAIFCSLFQLI